MKPAPFDYHRPADVAQAVAVLGQDDTKVLAGGQSLVPLLSMRLANPGRLVDINHVRGLSDLEVTADATTVGALVRQSEVERDERVYQRNPLLRRTLAMVAHPVIRNRGTAVGSLVHADPAAELPAVLALLDGAVHVVSEARGQRTIAAKDLFAGPLESSVAADELAVQATFPHPPAGSGTAWMELARRHGDYAIVGVGTVVQYVDGVITHARAALIGVAEAPVLVDLTPACTGSTYDGVDADGVGDLVAEAIEPAGDIHATAAYRRHLAQVLTVRAVEAAHA